MNTAYHGKTMVTAGTGSSDLVPTGTLDAVVAGVFDGKTLRLFVNGETGTKTEPSGEYDRRRSSVPNRGELSTPEVSTSRLRGESTRSASPTSPATPPTSRAVDRFEADEHTLALYHFDEGEGDVLNDTSGNDHHGKIVGAKWVRIDEQSKLAQVSRALSFNIGMVTLPQFDWNETTTFTWELRVSQDDDRWAKSSN